jgi:hypothetical protein
MIDQPPRRPRKVRSPELGRVFVQHRQQRTDRHDRHRGGLELAADRLGIKRMQPRHGGGQQSGDLAEEGGPAAERVGEAESGQQRRAWCAVHDHKGTTKTIVRPACGPDDGSRKVSGGDRCLNQRLLASRVGVGHHACDQVMGPAVGRLRQREREQLGPEAPGQRDRGACVRQGRRAGNRTQHGQQPIS